MKLFDHISQSVTELARAVAFYDAILATLGYVRVWTHEDAAGYGRAGGEDELALKATPGPLVPGARSHVAFAAANRATVDAFHRAALASGGADAGAPGLRPHYGPRYYAAFVADPDGHRVEVVCHVAK